MGYTRIKTFYRSLLNLQKGLHSLYAQAMDYICHQLLNTVFTILKTGEEYNPVYPSQIDLSKLAD